MVEYPHQNANIHNWFKSDKEKIKHKKIKENTKKNTGAPTQITEGNGVGGDICVLTWKDSTLKTTKALTRAAEAPSDSMAHPFAAEGGRASGCAADTCRAHWQCLALRLPFAGQPPRLGNTRTLGCVVMPPGTHDVQRAWPLGVPQRCTGEQQPAVAPGRRTPGGGGIGVRLLLCPFEQLVHDRRLLHLGQVQLAVCQRGEALQISPQPRNSADVQ